MRNKLKTIAITAVFAAAATPVLAADAAATQEQVQNAFDVAFGAAVTSDYISRGSTQTEGDPALQGYVEASYGMVYGGVWASNVSFAGSGADVEVDVYAGVRPEFGNLSLDFGFVQYLYGNDPTDYGDIYAKADYAFTDQFSAGVEYYHEPYANAEWAAVTTTIALPQDFSFSGQVGHDFVSGGKVAWDAGVSRTFFDVATVDLRYHDSNQDQASFVVTLSFDTALSALSGK